MQWREACSAMIRWSMLCILCTPNPAIVQDKPKSASSTRVIDMFSYVVGFLAISIVLINPIIQLLTPGVPRIVRIPLPRKLDEKYLALESPDFNVSSCPLDAYTVQIFCKEPLVLYLENFLSADERSHLLEIRFVPHKYIYMSRIYSTNPWKRATLHAVHRHPRRRRIDIARHNSAGF